MSSLGISVLILALAAIAAVVAVNLVQALSRRKRLSECGVKSRDPGSPPGGDEPLAAPAPPSAPRSAPLPQRASRREPRLGEVSDSGAPEYDHTMPPEGRGEARGHRAPVDPGSEDATVVAPPVPDAQAVSVAGAQVAAATGWSTDAASQKPGFDPARSSPRRDDSRFDVATPAFEAGSALLSPLCDCIVTLLLERPMPGERLLALTQGVRRAGGKPILADGIPADSRKADAVEVEARALAAGVAYRALRMGVLLANRQGPLNAMEYTDFVSAVQSVADSLSSLADIPEMADTIARARDLDATCAQLDAQIGLNVDSPEPLGPAQAAALAADLGLVDRGGHRHVRLGSNGELVFTMSLTGSPQRLGFLLDVPRTAESLDGFAQMVSCAQDAATRLSGQLADDSGRPISNEALGTISRQLRQRYESLDAIGLSAGSPLAMRVFN